MYKILLPVDGSDPCKRTLDWAAEHFDRPDASFVLINAVEVNEGVRHEPAAYEEIAQDILAQARESLSAKTTAPITTTFMLGDPVKSICKTAVEEKVDLVIVGSHGRAGLRKLVMGSVSEGVLEHCDASVIIYRNVIRSAD